MKSVYRDWCLNHSLAPKNEVREQKKWQPIPIPQIPERKKINSYINKPSEKMYSQRSRKHRLKEERITQIEKSNRLLYEKIKKIMVKGSKTQRKLQPQPETEQLEMTRDKFLNTTTKPLSLPHVSTNMSSLRTTKSELSNILDDRGGFAQKYFDEISRARDNQLSTESLGEFECFGWKVRALLLDEKQYIVLKGRKGKKELTKKYLKAKVNHKIQNGLEEWVSSKFEFQI